MYAMPAEINTSSRFVQKTIFFFLFSRRFSLFGAELKFVAFINVIIRTRSTNKITVKY